MAQTKQKRAGVKGFNVKRAQWDPKEEVTKLLKGMDAEVVGNQDYVRKIVADKGIEIHGKTLTMLRNRRLAELEGVPTGNGNGGSIMQHVDSVLACIKRCKGRENFDKAVALIDRVNKGSM